VRIIPARPEPSGGGGADLNTIPPGGIALEIVQPLTKNILNTLIETQIKDPMVDIRRNAGKKTFAHSGL
jgi:hypothetical protein